MIQSYFISRDKMIFQKIKVKKVKHSYMDNIESGKLLFMISQYTEITLSELEKYNYTRNIFYNNLYETKYNKVQFSVYSSLTNFLINKCKENELYKNIVDIILSIYRR